VLCLTLALDHQRKHRSFLENKKVKEETTQINSDIEDFGESEKFNRKVYKVLGKLAIPGVLFLLYFISIFIGFFLNRLETFWVFVTFYSLQRVPLLVLLGIIIGTGAPEPEGPTIFSKALLALGILLNLVNEVPLTMWSYIVLIASSNSTEPCNVGGFASTVDVIHLLFLLSQIFLFFFLRAEFFRNKDYCVWKIVSKRQEGFFDFREFSDGENENETGGGDVHSKEYDKLYNNAKNTAW